MLGLENGMEQVYNEQNEVYIGRNHRQVNTRKVFTHVNSASTQDFIFSN